MAGNPILFSDPQGLVKNDPNKDANVAKPTEAGQHIDYEDGHFVSTQNEDGVLIWSRGTQEITVTHPPSGPPTRTISSVPNVFKNLGITPTNEITETPNTIPQSNEDVVSGIEEVNLRLKQDLLRKELTTPIVKVGGKILGAIAQLVTNPIEMGDGEFPKEISSGFLEDHENAGGHTRRKHVGKTDEELVQRLSDEPWIPGSSSYPNITTAEAVTSAAILGQMSKIDEWLKSNNDKNLTLEYYGSVVTGRGIKRGEEIVSDRKDALVILKKHPTGGYIVLTSYPRVVY
ncbi:MAG: RNase A-like domain-containing protein [Candidatus Kapaibacterium sp.]|jgi:hypothetical protein